MYIYIPHEYIDCGTEYSKHKIDPDLQSELQNIELRGLGRTILEHTSMRIHFFKNEVAEKASYAKLSKIN